MFTFYPSQGIVKRDSDGAVVSPVQSADDPGFIEYTAWANAGNYPTVAIETAMGSRTLTKLEFRRRFTMSERITLDAAVAGLNPLLPIEIVAGLRTMQKDLDLAEEINLDDADVIYGLGVLEQVGLISPGRAAEIRV